MPDLYDFQVFFKFYCFVEKPLKTTKKCLSSKTQQERGKSKNLLCFLLQVSYIIIIILVNNKVALLQQSDHKLNANNKWLIMS